MFQPQFAPLVEAGTKRQTIRPTPKRMPQVGECESWREWTGKPYRSKQRELAKVIITDVMLISLSKKRCGCFGVRCPSRLWKSTTLEEFALADGFNSVEQMRQWFIENHGLPFRGILIKAK